MILAAKLKSVRVCCGFRTFSDDGSYAIAGMIPMDILPDEMIRMYDGTDFFFNRCTLRYDAKRINRIAKQGAQTMGIGGKRLMDTLWWVPQISI